MANKDTNLQAQELSMEELVDVTGACRPGWTVSAKSDGMHTEVHATMGKEHFTLTTAGPAVFHEEMRAGDHVQWRLDSGVNAGTHTFDVKFRWA